MASQFWVPSPARPACDEENRFSFSPLIVSSLESLKPTLLAVYGVLDAACKEEMNNAHSADYAVSN